MEKPSFLSRSKLSIVSGSELQGKTIVMTRPEQEVCELTLELEKRGAQVFSWPTFRLVAKRDKSISTFFKHEFFEYDWIVLTSKNALSFFLEALQAHQIDRKELATFEIASIGTATTKALKESGLKVDLEAQDSKTEGLIEILRTQDLKGKKLLLPRSAHGNMELVKALRALGAEVKDLALYQPESIKPEQESEIQALREGIDQGRFAAITFMSGSALRGACEALGPEAQELLAKCPLVSIGPRTSAVFKEFGLEVAAEAENHSISGLVQALIVLLKP